MDYSATVRMGAINVVNGGAAAPFRSLLDKPLHELTEEDIAQVTREDCRTYLKQKGMRRPSWNKSQAIQQVISLKTLFETTEIPGDGVPRKAQSSPLPETTPPAVTSNSDEVETSIPADVTGESSEWPAEKDDKFPCPWCKILFLLWIQPGKATTFMLEAPHIESVMTKNVNN
ncbi:hypothetical protein NMG60_11025362 [Bertholletia excelsa]